MTRRFYGFRFTDGTNTTTGRDGEFCIAGGLYSFSSRTSRDEWVSDGYKCRVPRDWGQFRRAVTTRSLPMGWSVRDASPHE